MHRLFRLPLLFIWIAFGIACTDAAPGPVCEADQRLICVCEAGADGTLGKSVSSVADTVAYLEELLRARTPLG